MTSRPRKSTITLSDAEIRTALCLLAVRAGLRIPETPEEVAEFEESSSNASFSLRTRRPTLASVTSRARELRSRGVLLRRAGNEYGPTELRMAARNRAEITPAIEKRMNDAIKKPRKSGHDEC